MALGDLLRDLFGEKEDRSGLGEGSFQTHRTSSGTLTGRTRNLNACIGWKGIWSWKQKVGVAEETARNVKKEQLAWEVAMERGPINLVPFNTRIVHESIQIETRFSQKNDDLGMPPWTL